MPDSVDEMTKLDFGGGGGGAAPTAASDRPPPRPAGNATRERRGLTAEWFAENVGGAARAPAAALLGDDEAAGHSRSAHRRFAAVAADVQTSSAKDYQAFVRAHKGAAAQRRHVILGCN